MVNFMTNPSSELEMINLKDMKLLVDSRPDSILEFINNLTDVKQQRWNLKLQLEELSQILDLEDGYEKENKKVFKSAKM